MSTGGFIPINTTEPGPAAAAAEVLSDPINGSGGRHLTLEVWADEDLAIELETLGPDGEWRVAVTEAYAFASGEVTPYNYPVALSTFRVRATGGGAGWRGYVIARVV